MIEEIDYTSGGFDLVTLKIHTQTQTQTHTSYAQVVELVDTLDLKSNGHLTAVRVQVPPWVLLCLIINKLRKYSSNNSS